MGGTAVICTAATTVRCAGGSAVIGVRGRNSTQWAEEPSRGASARVACDRPFRALLACVSSSGVAGAVWRLG